MKPPSHRIPPLKWCIGVVFQALQACTCCFFDGIMGAVSAAKQQMKATAQASDNANKNVIC